MPYLARSGPAAFALALFLLAVARPSAGGAPSISEISARTVPAAGHASPASPASPESTAQTTPTAARAVPSLPDSAAQAAEILDEGRDNAPPRPHTLWPDGARGTSTRPERPETAQPERPEPVRARFKSDLVLPFASVFLPGFGQAFQGEWTGAAYAGTAVAGLSLLIASAPDLVRESALPDAGGNSGWWPDRTFELGGLAYQGSGFLSAYAAFRSSVPRFQDEDGKYRFLGRRESIGELMRSPFRFDHLSRPSAWIPLGLLAGGVGALVAYDRTHAHTGHWSSSPDDYLFVGSEAWNAGVSEEAVFRGWIYPVAYQYLWQNFWLADAAQALLFGAAHYDPSANPLPWPQAALGFYFGWLARKNGWTLSESVFVHAWWDMLLFAGALAVQSEADAPASLHIAVPVAW